jgi:hypothetical protein
MEKRIQLKRELTEAVESEDFEKMNEIEDAGILTDADLLDVYRSFAFGF